MVYTLGLSLSAERIEGSNPSGSTKFAHMVELEDTLVLEASGEIRVGSNPTVGTRIGRLVDWETRQTVNLLLMAR